MTKRILVVPDVHGETFWKDPILKYIDKVDRVIFLGDYLDPYRKEGKEYTPQGLFDNLMDIMTTLGVTSCMGALFLSD